MPKFDAVRKGDPKNNKDARVFKMERREAKSKNKLVIPASPISFYIEQLLSPKFANFMFAEPGRLTSFRIYVGSMIPKTAQLELQIQGLVESRSLNLTIKPGNNVFLDQSLEVKSGDRLTLVLVDPMVEEANIDNLWISMVYKLKLTRNNAYDYLVEATE